MTADLFDLSNAKSTMDVAHDDALLLLRLASRHLDDSFQSSDLLLDQDGLETMRVVGFEGTREADGLYRSFMGKTDMKRTCSEGGFGRRGRKSRLRDESSSVRVRPRIQGADREMMQQLPDVLLLPHFFFD